MIFKINFEQRTVNTSERTMKAAALSVDFVGAEISTENPKTLDVCKARELFRTLPPSVRCNWCIDLLRVWMQLKSSGTHTYGVSHSCGVISSQINRLPSAARVNTRRVRQIYTKYSCHLPWCKSGNVPTFHSISLECFQSFRDFSSKPTPQAPGWTPSGCWMEKVEINTCLS